MHVHHEAAHRWFGEGAHRAWATCPITENGFIRIASHPRYPNRPGDVSIVLASLRRFCAAQGHQFWTEDISIRDLLVPGCMITHAQIADLFLLGLAVHKGGKLATLDQRIPVTAVPGGGEALELITPREHSSIPPLTPKEER
jgi:uncharacterized protein